MATSTAKTASRLAYPDGLPDPPRSHDMRQRRQLARADSALIAHFAAPNVLVCGEGYLRIEAGNDSERYSPDLVVAFDVDAESIIQRNGYVISEVGKPPEFALEIASESTGWRDYTVKRTAYARYKIQEYWRFDQSGGHWHDAPLAGDTLVDGEYVPIPIHREPSGLLWGRSQVLGLDICWDDALLRFYDPVGAKYLPVTQEMRAELDETRIELDEARARAQAAEAEVQRLREQLRRT